MSEGIVYGIHHCPPGQLGGLLPLDTCEQAGSLRNMFGAGEEAGYHRDRDKLRMLSIMTWQKWGKMIIL